MNYLVVLEVDNVDPLLSATWLEQKIVELLTQSEDATFTHSDVEIVAVKRLA